MFLYKIKNNINEKEYVGITTNLKRRWKEHGYELRSNRHKNKTHKNWVWSFNKDDLEEKYNEAKKGNKNRKDIYQFSLEGVFIKKINRSSLTRNELKSIQNVCSGRRNSAYGFKYSYKKEEIAWQ